MQLCLASADWCLRLRIVYKLLQRLTCLQAGAGAAQVQDGSGGCVALRWAGAGCGQGQPAGLLHCQGCLLPPENF